MVKVREIISKNLLTKSGIPSVDIVCNPYVGCPNKCFYCYAEFMKRFTGHLGEEWGEFIDIKSCDAKITQKKVSGKSIMLSSVTDPYNRYEKRYRKTRKILEQLLEAGAGVEIITKSDLILRDIDLLNKFNPPNGAGVNVTFSFSSVDDNFAKIAEPRASVPSKRIAAAKVLRENGIRVYAFVAPILPKITNIEKIVDTLASDFDELWFDSLNIHNPTVRRKVMNFIREHFPELIPLYKDIYVDGLSRFWEDTREEITRICKAKKIPFKIFF